MTPKQGPDLNRMPRLGLRLVGALLLAVTAGIHLDLYLTGYRGIPTIGWLFLLQIITGFALALIIAVIPSRLAAAAGGLFALAILGGYLLSVWVGLFGFTEIRTTAGIVAGIIEVAAFVALAAFALIPSPAGQSKRLPAAAGQLADRVDANSKLTTIAAGGLAVVALVLLFVAVSTAGSSTSTSASGALRATTIGGVKVLTNSKGFTLYWFVPDTSSKSNCNGICAGYWPPVKGPTTAASGVTGKLGTIKRNDGSLQETYNGHPLYTYASDSRPGQANGNNLTLNGGLWHEVTVSG